MDWMYANCSTTAQRGALDWFKKFRDASKPVFETLYTSVETGVETRRTLEAVELLSREPDALRPRQGGWESQHLDGSAGKAGRGDKLIPQTYDDDFVPVLL